MDNDNLIELTASLLHLKVQYDKQFEKMCEIVESENWEDFEQFKESLGRSLKLSNQTTRKLNMIKNQIE